VNTDNRNSIARVVSAIALCVASLSGTLSLRAQNATQPVYANRLSHLNALATRFGPGLERRLSAGGANMFHLADVLSDPGVMRPADMSAAREVLHRALSRSGRGGRSRSPHVGRERRTASCRQ
jgi:hypothetical protein